MKRAPDFLELTLEDCRRILARNRFGRLAFVGNEGIAIEPIGYVMRGNWLYARSAHGMKIASLQRRPFVVFQIDEVDGPFDWRSVMVRGTVYELPENGSAIELRQRRKAIAAIRSVMPSAFTDEDPVPERQIVYGLHINEMSGRMAQHRRPLRALPRRARARAAKSPPTRARREEF